MMSGMRSAFVVLTSFGLSRADTINCSSPSIAQHGYCDHRLPIDVRVEDLLGRLTMAEKTASVLETAGSVSRLGVPTLGIAECLRGYLSMFPQALTLSQSWSTSLVQAVAAATSDEVRGAANAAQGHGGGGSLACFDPVINVCRDPRWGRCQEGYGEDAELTATLGEQYVTGLQFGASVAGKSDRYLKVLAGCKHFDVHSGPENNNAGWSTGPVGTPPHTGANQTCAAPGKLPNDGHGVYVGSNTGPGMMIENNTGGCRWSFDSRVSRRDWIEHFQLPFKRCVAAGARSLMCSYNKVNGVPSCANKPLLSDLLRDDWGFGGYVVSDCIAIQQIMTTHHYANSLEEAAAMALEAGTDLDLCGGFTPYLTRAVEAGIVSESRVDVAVRRVLKARFELGDFDPADMVPFRAITEAVAHRHTELARKAAREGIVLLENRNETLPLSHAQLVSGGLTVALIGPCANNTHCHVGDYTPKSDGPVITPLVAMQKQIGAAHVLYAPGCPPNGGCNEGPCVVSCRCVNQSHFAAAVGVAKAADIVIFVGGASALTEWMEGEAADKASLFWPGEQENLAKAVKAAAGSKPFVVAIATGSPLVSQWAFSTADAVLNIGYGGQAAGLGFVDVLFGEPEGPSGKLTVTYYKPEQLGDFMSYDMSGSLGPKGKTYKYLTTEPFYRFGFGRSYTEFDYSSLVVTPSAASSPCSEAVVSVSISNVGKAVGAEIAQLYLRSLNASVPTPPIKLVGFGRTPAMQPGESALLSFIVKAEHRAVVLDYDHSQVLEPGTFEVIVGGHLPDFESKEQEKVLRSTFTNSGRGPLRQCTTS